MASAGWERASSAERAEPFSEAMDAPPFVRGGTPPPPAMPLSPPPFQGDRVEVQGHRLLCNAPESYTVEASEAIAALAEALALQPEDHYWLDVETWPTEQLNMLRISGPGLFEPRGSPQPAAALPPPLLVAALLQEDNPAYCAEDDNNHGLFAGEDLAQWRPFVIYRGAYTTGPQVDAVQEEMMEGGAVLRHIFGALFLRVGRDAQRRAALSRRAPRAHLRRRAVQRPPSVRAQAVARGKRAARLGGVPLRERARARASLARGAVRDNARARGRGAASGLRG